jgi:DNA-binding GntR family transcriptional regulator
VQSEVIVTAVGDAVPRQTLADLIYERIRLAIFSGELKAGTELNQVDLARQYGASRVPVREALRRLQAERLLVANPFQRFVVSVLSPSQVLELHDIRTELEVFALRQAAAQPEAVRAERIAAAEGIVGAMSATMSTEQWLRSDRDFHLALNGPDTAVAGMIEDLRDRVHRYLHLAGTSPRRAENVLDEHAAIVRALRGGDPTKIETAIRVHVDRTRDILEHAMREATSPPD